MLNQLDLNLLYVLHILFEEKTVTRTGERLGRTQSAVSNSLNRLRQALADPLFVRTGNRFIPTPFAEQLRKPVAEIIHIVEDILVERGEFDPAKADLTFRIGVPERLVIPLLQPLLLKLSEDAPGISVDIQTSDREQAISLLENGRIDLALGWFDQPPTNLSSKFLFQEELVLVVRNSHPLATRCDEPDITDILSFSHLVVSSAGDRRAAFDIVLARKGLRREVKISVGTFSIVPSLLASTDMVGVFGAKVVKELFSPGDVSLVEVPIDFSCLDQHMVWNKRFDQDPAHKWIRNAISVFA